MARKILSLCKFVGTISLGLLTGFSYTLSTTAVPALLSLPTAPTAQRAASHLRAAALARRRLLAATSALALSAAFILAPSRARHPYLLWTAVAALAASPGVDYAADALLAPGASSSSPSSRSKSGSPPARLGDGAGLFGGVGGAPPNGSDDGILVDIEDEKGAEEVNGEEVRGVLERMRVREAWRAGVAGVGFAMAVVGVWGDRF